MLAGQSHNQEPSERIDRIWTTIYRHITYIPIPMFPCLLAHGGLTHEGARTVEGRAAC